MNKIKRINRLSDFRNQKNVENYYIEVSDEAIEYVKKNKLPTIWFSYYNNQIILNGEKGFTRYIVVEKITTAESMIYNTHILIYFSNIDYSVKRGELLTAVEMIGEWLDEQVKQNYGWKINNIFGRYKN